MLDICLLGVGGMMPLPNRFLTSMLARVNGKMLLIDCGEGTQVTAKILGWGFKNIDVMCFTHLHADHISGLPGMLLTIGNSGRTDTLEIIGPVGIKRAFSGLSTICPELPYPVEVTEIELSEDNYLSDEIIFGDFVIKAIFCDHKISCYAYSVEIKRSGKFLPSKAEELGVPKNLWGLLQNGDEITLKDNVITPEMVLTSPRKGIKVSYCTDTRPLDRFHNFIRNSDLFICEGMYGEEEKKEGAIQKKHMIFSEAATLATNGDVKELWLTHFSPALAEPELFLENATNIFHNSKLGFDRITKTIFFED